MKRKGIILAGGAGTRLHPATLAVSKQLLNVYDKPMVYYPLSTLMLAGIREILLISTPQDTPIFKKLLGDGKNWGISMSYAVQPNPRGIGPGLPDRGGLCPGGPSALVLGDNIFYGHHFPHLLEQADCRPTGATVFTNRVNDPERYGVAAFFVLPWHFRAGILQRERAFLKSGGAFVFPLPELKVVRQVVASQDSEVSSPSP
jgi:glucose-1-phosphate thymidylyltransferase